MKFEIGQELISQSNYNLTGLTNDIIEVKKGDKGYIDSSGFIHYETGKARGKMTKIPDAEMEGYNTENIAKIIYEQLKWKLMLSEHMENYDLEEQEFIDEIDYILSEIL